MTSIQPVVMAVKFHPPNFFSSTKYQTLLKSGFGNEFVYEGDLVKLQRMITDDNCEVILQFLESVLLTYYRRDA